MPRPAHPRSASFFSSFPFSLGLLVLLAAAPARAAVISVCASGCDETVIQDAVDGAAPGDTIFLPDTSYREAGIVVDVRVNFEGVVGMNLTLIEAQGGTAFKTGENSGRVLDILPGVAVTMRNIRFRHARSTGDGGTIRNRGHLVLRGVRVGSSVASGKGGAIANEGVLVLDDVVIGSSHAGSDGGGIHNSVTGVLVARDCELTGSGCGNNGGNFHNAGVAMLRSCRVDGGEAVRGGGIASSGSTWFSGLVDGNTAWHGAGIYQNAGSVEVLRSEITQNQAHMDGGGFYVLAGTATLADSTVYANRADHGAGIFHASSSPLQVRNSTVNFNLAEVDGGGILVDEGRHVNLSSATVAYNSADWNEDGNGQGGGIFLRPCSSRGLVICQLSSASLRNTILSENWDRNPGSDTPDDCLGELNSDGYNLVGAGGSSAIFPCRIEGDLTGVQFGQDPGLMPLNTNGGTPTHPDGSEPRTHALTQGSAAVDAGDPSGCGDGQGGVLGADQRGGGRVGTCDVGATERGAVPAVVLFADGFETGTTLSWW